MRLDASALRALNLMDNGNVSLAFWRLYCNSYRHLEGFRDKEYDATWTVKQM